MSIIFKSVVAALLAAGVVSLAHAQGTSFNYQGRLNSGGEPADGWHDLQFTLYDAETGGVAVGGPLLATGLPISNGLFTVTLDFGLEVWDGTSRWLEIGVRTNGGGVFTIQVPRQTVTAAPYAITASRISGVVPSSAVSGTYGEAVTFSNPSNVLAGDGSGLTGLNASALSGGVVPAGTLGNAWKIGGNAGTLPGMNFVGTIDNQPLEMAVNGQRALRLEPAPETPNVIGGAGANSVTPGIRGATIAGGGLPPYPNQVTADYGAVGGGTFNISGGVWATIAGGRDNRTYSESSTVAGGFRNLIETNSSYGFIGGGIENEIQQGAAYAVIPGGYYNLVRTQALGAAIGGGYRNLADTNTDFSVIAGGRSNTNSLNSPYGAIAGGLRNLVGPSVTAGTVSGGQDNWAGANHATVGGGLYNTNTGPGATIGGGNGNVTLANDTVIAGGILNAIGEGSFSSVIGGGRQNQVTSGNNFATVGGGYSNTASAAYGVVPGGYGNTVAGNYSMAAGQRARANFSGTFVWADSSGGDFSSTAPNQFLVRAGGGVGINTANPTAALHVGGTPGVDGVRFPDGTLQTTAATAAAPPAVVFAYGPGNNPASTNNFLAEPATVTVTSSSQKILVTSHKAFGSTAAGGAQLLNLYIGYRPVGSSATVSTVGAGVLDNRVPTNTRITMGLSGMITGLTPGNYQVGLVGVAINPANWNSNEYSYTTAVVY